MNKTSIRITFFLALLQTSSAYASPTGRAPVSLGSLNVGMTEFSVIAAGSDGNVGYRIWLNAPKVTSSGVTCILVYVDPSDSNGYLKINMIMNAFMSTKTWNFSIDGVAGDQGFCHAQDVSAVQ